MEAQEKCHDVDDMGNGLGVEADNIVQICQYELQPRYDLVNNFHKPKGRGIGALWHAQKLKQLIERAESSQRHLIWVRDYLVER